MASHKLGVCRVDSAGKPCSTLFTKLSYNGSSSLLRCEIVIHYVGGSKERTIFHTVHYSDVYATTVLDFPNRSATCTIHLCIVLCIMEINYCTREVSRGTHNALYLYLPTCLSYNDFCTRYGVYIKMVYFGSSRLESGGSYIIVDSYSCNLRQLSVTIFCVLRLSSDWKNAPDQSPPAVARYPK